ASSVRSFAAAPSSIGISSARESAPSARPRSRHPASGSRYAPRPGALPRRSTESSPRGERTTRTSSRLGRVVRQATQVRCGRVRAAWPPEDPPARRAGGGAPRLLVPLGALLFSSQGRPVPFIPVLPLRLGRFRLDLRHPGLPALRLVR